MCVLENFGRTHISLAGKAGYIFLLKDLISDRGREIMVREMVSINVVWEKRQIQIGRLAKKGDESEMGDGSESRNAFGKDKSGL